MDRPSLIEGLERATPVDLSADTLHRLGLDPTDDDQLRSYIFNGSVRYGGYGEKRSLYQRSPHFTGPEVRDIHLGLDIWANALTSVFALWDGEVVGCHDNVGKGDYGPTLILRHRFSDEVIHSLYGHLSRKSVEKWSVGCVFKAGDRLAYIGHSEENGGWLPHLHFQLIKNLEGNTTDYPGVCKKSDWERYHTNCPDPKMFIFDPP